MASTSGRSNGTTKARKRNGDANELQGVPKRPKVGVKTDVTRWRLKDDESRHTWHYLEDDEAAESWPQSYAEKWYLGLPLVRGHSSRRQATSANAVVGLAHATNPPEHAGCREEWAHFV